MNRKVLGLLIGVGVGTVTGLTVLFLRTEKPRRFLRKSVKQLRGALPEPAQMQRFARQTSRRLSKVTDNAKDTTRHTMKRVKDAGSDLGENVKQLTSVGS